MKLFSRTAQTVTCTVSTESVRTVVSPTTATAQARYEAAIRRTLDWYADISSTPVYGE